MSGHTYTQDNYSNPRCAHARRGLITGEEIARDLISALSVEYGITSERLLAAMRDRASVNVVAMRSIKVVFPDMIDVGCYSHTIDLVGDKFRAPNIEISFVYGYPSLHIVLGLGYGGRVEQERQCLLTVPLAGGASGKLCLR